MGDFSPEESGEGKNVAQAIFPSSIQSLDSLHTILPSNIQSLYSSKWCALGSTAASDINQGFHVIKGNNYIGR